MFINPIQRDMDSGELAAIVALVTGALTYFGIQIDPNVVNGAVTGFFAIVALIAGVWSWYIHRQNNQAQ
jgi:4-amino-4-deoxy-L-arabinose transferase-like glycosyltransferase